MQCGVTWALTVAAGTFIAAGTMTLQLPPPVCRRVQPENGEKQRGVA